MKYSYPKGEIVWVGHYGKDRDLRYIITSKPTRDFYFLYAMKAGKFVKLGKDKNPCALEKKFIEP